MGRGKRLDYRTRGAQRLAKRFVDRRGPERGFERAGGIERDAVERDEVRRSDENRRIEWSGGSRGRIRIRAHRSGEHQPGVRRDDRVEMAPRDQVAIDSADVIVHFSGERAGARGIPRPGHGSGPSHPTSE